jgi:hypothetical protein
VGRRVMCQVSAWKGASLPPASNYERGMRLTVTGGPQISHTAGQPCQALQTTFATPDASAAVPNRRCTPLPLAFPSLLQQP